MLENNRLIGYGLEDRCNLYDSKINKKVKWVNEFKNKLGYDTQRVGTAVLQLNSH